MSSPNTTTTPELIPTRLNRTCAKVNVEVVIPKIMMSPFVNKMSGVLSEMHLFIHLSRMAAKAIRDQNDLAVEAALLFRSDADRAELSYSRSSYFRILLPPVRIKGRTVYVTIPEDCEGSSVVSRDPNRAILAAISRKARRGHAGMNLKLRTQSREVEQFLHGWRWDELQLHTGSASPSL